ncbi:hypothetical protein, partial [Caballeronia calidae]|uniref:hypothetical protein n=1 Tax=Caballeronia calidae TaxID=1777139 RepID=UPI001E5B61A5
VSMRAARKRFLVASSIGFFAMACISNQSLRDTTHQHRIGCHLLWKYQYLEGVPLSDFTPTPGKA